MFIVIMVLLLGTCVSVLSSIYYNTTSLQNTYWSVNMYYWAYYWAISSIERGLLMSKLKYPTYVWSGWFKWTTPIWANSNMFSGDFWRLNRSENTMIWTVNSRTTNIKGTIDTKTLRAISFIKYIDPYENQYKNEWIETRIHWISDGLTFSWTANPSNTWRDLQNLKINVDFNRFFGMNSENTILRGLLKWTRENREWAEDPERDVPLTWEFVFWEIPTIDWENPRPTLSWKNSNQPDWWF